MQNGIGYAPASRMTYQSLTVIVTAALFASVSGAGAAHAQASARDSKAASGDGDDSPSATPSRGESDEARRLFRDGHDQYTEGNFEQALDLFERAYRLSKRHELLYNIALAHDRLRQDEKAVDSYQKFLERAEDPQHRSNAIARLKLLREAIARNEHPEPKAVPPISPKDAAASTRASDESVRWQHEDYETKVDEPSSVLESFWFWAAIGTVVAGGAAVGVWAWTREPDEPVSGPTPNTGVTIETLTLAR